MNFTSCVFWAAQNKRSKVSSYLTFPFKLIWIGALSDRNQLRLRSTGWLSSGYAKNIPGQSWRRLRREDLGQLGKKEEKPQFALMCTVGQCDQVEALEEVDLLPGLRWPLDRDHTACVCLCEHVLPPLFLNSKDPAVKPKPTSATLAACNCCVIGVSSGSHGAWGQPPSMWSYPSASELEDGNQFAGHMTPLWWNQTTPLSAKGKGPSDLATANAGGVSCDSLAEILRRLRCVTSAPTFCWQWSLFYNTLCLCTYVVPLG